MTETIFEVTNLETEETKKYKVEGDGQIASGKILENFPNDKIVLVGFIIDGKFIHPWL